MFFCLRLTWKDNKNLSNAFVSTDTLEMSKQAKTK